MDLRAKVRELMLIDGLSGYENEVARVVKESIAPFVDEVTIDRFGNVVAKLNGTDLSAPVVMFGAHMDQLGLVVRYISEDGYIYPERLGGVPEKCLQSMNVRVRNMDGKYFDGIIGTKSFHAMPVEERMTVIKLYDCYIDIGARSKKEVEELGIRCGCAITYRPHFQRMLNDRYSGTSIDDRSQVAAMIKVAENLSFARPKCDTYFVATVWEEYTLRGCKLPARAIQPDISIYFDVCITGDTPDINGIYNSNLGEGPAICTYSNHARGSLLGNIPSRAMTKLAEECAKENGIPLQYFASGGFMTDNCYIQDEVEKGCTVLDICTPTRYTHSSVELSDFGDLEKVVQLATAIANKVDSNIDCGKYWG